MSGEVINVYHDKHEDHHVTVMKRAFIAIISGHMKVNNKMIIEQFHLVTVCQHCDINYCTILLWFYLY